MGKGGCSEVAAQPVYVRVNLFRPRKKVQLLGRQSPEVTDGKRYRALDFSRATAKLPSTKMALIHPPTKRTQRYLSGAAFLLPHSTRSPPWSCASQALEVRQEQCWGVGEILSRGPVEAK